MAWVMRVHLALSEWEAAAIERLLQMPVMHADETSIRINKKNHWLHSYSSGSLIVKFCHPKPRHRGDGRDQHPPALRCRAQQR